MSNLSPSVVSLQRIEWEWNQDEIGTWIIDRNGTRLEWEWNQTGMGTWIINNS